MSNNRTSGLKKGGQRWADCKKKKICHKNNLDGKYWEHASSENESIQNSEVCYFLFLLIFHCLFISVGRETTA